MNAVVVNPPPDHSAAFGFGQTESDRDRGALQGLKFLSAGMVVVHGDTVIIDGRVQNPAEDWAVIRLKNPVDEPVAPLTIAAVDPAQLPKYFPISTAGYPSDHRMGRGNGIDASEGTPNVELLLAASTIARITSAQAQVPCP